MSLSAEASRILHVMLAHEPALWKNDRRCRALLADELPEFPTEQVALRRALAFGIPAELASRNPAEPLSTLLARLAGALQSVEAMRADAAQWAVLTWASAMGIAAPGYVAPRREHAEKSTVNNEWLEVPASSVVAAPAPKATTERSAPAPWLWALSAAPFIVVGLLLGIRSILDRQYELDAMWFTVTEHPVHFLAWYLPVAAIVLAAVSLVRFVRRS